MSWSNPGSDKLSSILILKSRRSRIEPMKSFTLCVPYYSLSVPMGWFAPTKTSLNGYGAKKPCPLDPTVNMSRSVFWISQISPRIDGPSRTNGHIRTARWKNASMGSFSSTGYHSSSGKRKRPRAVRSLGLMALIKSTRSMKKKSPQCSYRTSSRSLPTGELSAMAASVCRSTYGGLGETTIITKKAI